MHEHDESLSSTSEDDQQESEVEESLHVTAKDTCYVKLFTLINETIDKVAPGGKFNPLAGFMADEAGGIQEGLRRVYGQAVLERIKT